MDSSGPVGDASAPYPKLEWQTNLDIPLKASEEVVSIDLQNDLPDDPADLRTLLVEEGSDKAYWLSIALAYCNQEKVKESVELIKVALDVFQGPQSAWLHSFLTWAYLRLAKEQSPDFQTRDYNLNQAEMHLKESITIDHAWIGNMVATVDLYYQRDLYDKALETADVFIKNIHAEDARNGKQPKSNVMFLLLRAKLLYQKGNYTASLRLFQELLVLNPVLQPDPRIGIGLCFWQLKDYKMAIRSWKRAKELNPQNGNVKMLLLMSEFHEILSEAADDEAFKSSYTQALKNLKTVYAENPDNAALLVLFQSYCYFKGDYEKAIGIYQKKILPRAQMTSSTIFSESAFWCGRAHYALKNYKKAFLQFQESLKSNEDNFLARFGLGQTQLQNSLVEEGILTFENLYKTQENMQELNYILGLLYGAKCLSEDPQNPISSIEKQKFSSKAVQMLEKYVKLTRTKNSQLLMLKAYLVLAELYQHQGQHKTSLDYLLRSLEQLETCGVTSLPFELLNNIGALCFINGNPQESQTYFERAREVFGKSLENDGRGITIQYNLSRALEGHDAEAAQGMYEEIIKEHPGYIDARVRRLCLRLMKDGNDELSTDMSELIAEFPSNLDARSFYGWYLKNKAVNTNDEKGQSLESAHNRETLVKYDSHDTYALTSLANLYVTIARDNKKSSSRDEEKSKQSFVKAIQLYQKVLQIDPFNIFAAQGLAIVFAENKRMGPALDILRKVRDSLDNESVHINLGHCLVEMHEFSKAIENYEIAKRRFENEKSKALLANVLGRAWYLRGVKERSLECFKKSLACAEEALNLEKAKSESKVVPSVSFNVALLHFQIAETLRRSTFKQRTSQDLEDALKGLETGISLLEELLASKSNLIPVEELEQRVQLGRTTMKSALQRCIAEQAKFEADVSEKLANARKAMEESELKEQEHLRQLDEQDRIKKDQENEMFRKLQEETRKLMQERAELDAMVDIKNDDGSLSGDEEFKNDGSRKKKKIAKRTKKQEGEEEPVKKRKAKRMVIGDDEDGEGDEVRQTKRSKKQFLSKELIEDSDEESEANVSEKENESGEPSPPNGDNEEGLF
ncbi:LAMI_0C00430g1_1 [Lachancea mirantina]|uniref:LAMI_0C00430g1_1 n=1 Tax=Lachancea mirantina TaxID=1230905 RepID=A0A1G4IZI0_9SACH|nr:LAMI_0C00430g1_1 [Lachancea mirantina]